MTPRARERRRGIPVPGGQGCGRSRARLRPAVLLAAALIAGPLGSGCASLGLGPPPPPRIGDDGVAPAAADSDAPVARAAGVVFEDIDRDGRRDAGEPGVAGVRVSNGVEITRTDAEGRYAIEVPEGGAVFVIKPPDFRLPVGPDGVARFFRLHWPSGPDDAGFAFPGPEPTGPMPDQVDFALHRHAESDRFRMVAVGDPQPYDAQHLAWYARDVVAELVGIEAEGAILLGDLVGNDLSLFERLNRTHALIGIPIYPLIGNHDLNARSPDDARSDLTWRRIYGPSTYAFQVARVHFVVLNNVIWGGGAPRGWPGRGHYAGGLRPDQLRFLASFVDTLPEEDLLVLAMHIPLERRLTLEGRVAPQAIFEILSAHEASFSLSGHEHQLRHRFFDARDGFAPPSGAEHHHFTAGAGSGNRYRGARDELGIPHSTMRDGAPNGYALLEFDGAEYSIRYKAARRPVGHQMNIITKDRIEAGRRARVWVNVFNGSARTVVEMRVGDRDWVPLERTTDFDPLYEEARRRESTPRALDLEKPRRTNHLWKGRVPGDLEPGAHLIEVRATDMWGRVDREKRPLWVE